METERKPIGYNPQTGEPIYEEERKPIGYDPQTGEPIYEQPQPVGYDPQTGEPIYEQPQPIGYDTQTGEPIYQAAKKAGRGLGKIGGIVAAVAVVAVVAVAGVKTGTFLPAKQKVELAVYKTLEDQSHLVENLNVKDLLTSDNYTVSLEADMDEARGSVSYASSKSQKQLSGNVKISGYPNIDFIANMDKSTVKLSVPTLWKEVLVYDYTKSPDGYLSDVAGDELDAMNDALQKLYDSGEQEQLTKDTQSVFKNVLNEINVKKAGKDTFTVNGKSRKCQGYSFTVDEDVVLDLIDGIDDLYSDYFDDVELGRQWDAAIDEITNEFKGMDEHEITCYLYKGELAAVCVEIYRNDLEICFEGGATRCENITVRYDDEEILELEGSTANNTEELDLRIDGERILSMSYNYKTGDLDIEGREYDFEIKGNITRSGKLFHMELERLDVGNSTLSSISGTLEIKKSASFEKISGDEFDLGGATQRELEDLLDDLDDLEDYS